MNIKYILLLFSILFATNAMAISFDPSTLDPAAGQLSPLQGFFEGIGSSIDVYAEETGSEVYRVTGPSSSAWQMQYSYTGTSDIEFGLYNINSDLSALGDADLLTIFNGTTGSLYGDVTFVSDGFGFIMLSAGSTVLDSADYMARFGFYFLVDGDYYFSESDENSDGTDYFLTYMGNPGDSIHPLGLTSPEYSDDENHMYVAVEGDLVGFDFDELVIRTESIEAVPEPAAMLLLGTGLVGLAGISRKKIFKKK